MKQNLIVNNLTFELKRLKKISLKDFTNKTESISIFKDYSFALDEANYLILGDNGVGKSTLLRLLAGILIPDSGEIKFSKTPLFCISQNIIFFTRVSIYENLCFACEILTKTSLSKDRALEIIAFSGLDLDLNHISNGLSTGMSSRLMISLALLSGSDFIFFDETFANVQQDFRLKAIDHARKNQIQLIITTHSPHDFEGHEFKTLTLVN